MPYWKLTRAILFGLWILSTVVLWTRGQSFGVAILLGAVPSLILDALLVLAYGAWGVGQGARWLFRQFRAKP